MNQSATLSDFENTANEAGAAAKSTAKKVSGEMKESSSVIGSEVKNFISDLEELVSTKTGGSVDINKIRNDITSRIADYKASFDASSQKAMSQAKQQAETVDTYVHDEPWKSIGIGFAVGLLLGVVIARS